MKTALVVVLLLCGAAAAQETKKPAAPPAPPAAAASAAAQSVQAEVEAMAADLARMRNILRQMQMNMGFLPAGLTPEKHQFELDIEMWSALLDHMDRRLQAMRAASSK
jgi:hypothetical protein